MESKLLLSKLSATLWWTSFWNLDCYLVKSSATLWWSPLWNQNCYLSNLKPHCDEFHYVTKYCTVILFCYSKFVVTNSTFEWFYALMNSCNMFFQVTIQEKTFCHKFHIWFFPSCTDSICLTNADFKRKLLYLFPSWTDEMSHVKSVLWSHILHWNSFLLLYLKICGHILYILWSYMAIQNCLLCKSFMNCCYMSVQNSPFL